MGLYRLPKIIGVDKKPSFGARINYHHPLSQGLVGAWLFNEGGGRSFFNVVDSSYGTLAGTSGFLDDTIQIADGSITGNLPTVPQAYIKKFDTSRGITVLGIWKRDAVAIASNEGFISYGLGSQFDVVFALYITNTNKYISCYISDTGNYVAGYNIASTVALNDNVFTFVGMKFVPSDKVYIYKDGINIGQTASAPTSIHTPTADAGFYWNSQWDWTVVNNCLPGQCKLTLYYNRPLLDIEIASLYANPYQMFWPVVWDAYYAPAAAPPPTGGKSIFGYDSIFHAGGIIQT